MKGFDYNRGTAFMRDAFVPFGDAAVNIASSPFLYGLTIYTVFGLHRDKSGRLGAFRLEDHWKRLVSSARIMDFGDFLQKWNYEKFEKMSSELISRNELGGQGDFLVRVSVFVDALIAGTKIRGLPNAVCAYIYPMGEIVPRSGINVCVSSYRRNPDNAIPSRAKVNGGYVNVSLMKNEALANGYDDAVSLDGNGHVCEGTVANIFIIRNGALVTPSVSSDILEGITRNSLIRIARDEGLEVAEREVARSELYAADEAFICGTSARITPVLSVDRRIIGDGKHFPLTERLAAKYEAVQRGIEPKYKDWVKHLT